MTQAKRAAVLLAFVFALSIGAGHPAVAHSGLRFSSPLDGSTLGDSPSHVQLTFVEAPEPSLSTIRVVDTGGNAYHAERPDRVEGDPLSLAVRLRPLSKGVYIVNWRAVSAVDGHASSGAFAFGVLVDPSGAAASVGDTAPPMLEVVARTTLLAGMLLLLGAATASLARFGFDREVVIGTVGWLITAAGLALLTMAQLRVAGVSLSELAGTAIGRGLTWRFVGIAATGIAVAVAAHGRRTGRAPMVRAGMSGVAVTAIASIMAHSAAGHAAAGRWPVVPTVAIQVVHIIAAGAWLGGLAVLIAALRRPPSEAAHVSVRRFSAIALVGLVVVTASGVVRSFQEVSAWSDLFVTAYGGLIAAKAALLAGIAMLGAFNRWRTVPKASTDHGPLRKTAAIEVAVASLAVVAAGFLGALPPAAASRSIAGIEAAGADFGTTLRVHFAAASDQPGPNRFSVELRDYDSGRPVTAERVSLRFTPIDDPGVTPTSLPIASTGEGSYAGGGANLSFAGRWRVAVLVEHRGSSVEVPLDIETRVAPQPVSVLRIPGEPVAHTVEIAGMGLVRFTLDSERPGPTRLVVACFNVIPEVLPIDHMIVTTGTTSIRKWSVTRQDRNQFVATIDLHAGNNRIAVVARNDRGERLRAVLALDLPDN